jgi:hypothetical protein
MRSSSNPLETVLFNLNIHRFRPRTSRPANVSLVLCCKAEQLEDYGGIALFDFTPNLDFKLRHYALFNLQNKISICEMRFQFARDDHFGILHFTFFSNLRFAPFAFSSLHIIDILIVATPPYSPARS